MAHYTRFEVYVPIVFTTRELDPTTGASRPIRHSLPDDLIAQFITETVRIYGGITQANPIAPASYKGWWQSGRGGPIEIDYLTILFGLVKIHESDQAGEYFSRWKSQLEKDTHQEVILVIYHAVQTIGDFL